MNTLQQLTFRQSIALHLLPGALAGTVFVLLAPVFMQNGYPAILAMLAGAAPFSFLAQLGYLLMQSKRTAGKFSLKSVIGFREPLPKDQFIWIPLLMIVWAFLASYALGLLDQVIAREWFAWLPAWFSFFDSDQLRLFSRSALLITFWTGLVVNGVIGPIVEELYFRGHLLPRLSRFGNWAPLVNITLFSLYHFWIPSQFFSRIIWLLPWGYIIWKKRNIYLMMIAHCTSNILGWLLTWGLILGRG